MSRIRIAVVSDIHYASAAEQARGDDYELASVKSRVTRWLARAFRKHVWLHQPLQQNHLLDQFLEKAGDADFLIANGDYSCNTGFVGVSDDAALQSARECLGKLRARFGERMRATFGDHELGKISMFGAQGGMRLASWHCATDQLGLQPFWQVALGDHVLAGVASSLIALPVFEPDTLESERAQWRELREEHFRQIRQFFEEIQPHQKLLLFCHDPTALPFLFNEPAVRAKLAQIDLTIIGHLHTPLIFWKSRLLAGMPIISFLGHTARRMTTALNQARCWRHFHVRLCPSLAGTELLKDGGFCVIEIDAQAARPARCRIQRLPRQPARR